MQLPPLDVLKSWPTPNYIDPVTRGWENRIIIIILFPLVFLAISIRVFTRLRISRSFGVDDWLIIAAIFPTTGFMVISMLADFRFQWNRHMWDVPFSMIIVGMKALIGTQICFSLATGLTKCSMLTLVYRIVSKGSGHFPKLVLGVIILIVVQTILYCFMVIFQCKPVSQYWTPHFGPQNNCINEAAHLLAAGIINTISDLVTVLLPIPTVAKLQLPRKQQVAVVLLFAAGGLVTAAGAVRTYYTWKITTNYDASWNAYSVFWSSSLELYIGILCASIPASKLFFTVYLPKVLNGSIFSTFRSTANRITTDTESSHPPPSIIQNTHTHNSKTDKDLELGALEPIKKPEKVTVRKSLNTKLLSPIHSRFSHRRSGTTSASNQPTTHSSLRISGEEISLSELGDTETRPVSGVSEVESPRSDGGSFGDRISEASSRSSRGDGGDRVLDGVGSRDELCMPVEEWWRDDESVKMGGRYGRDGRREGSFSGGGPMGGLR